MSPVDAVMPLLQTPWTGRHGKHLPIVTLPGIRQEAITNLEAHWTGILTPEMRRILQRTCGLSRTPLGGIDFTGRWFPEEPLSIFRPSITLAIDDHGRRWIAELGKGRGLPGPVWCIFSRPEVAPSHRVVREQLGGRPVQIGRPARRKSHGRVPAVRKSQEKGQSSSSSPQSMCAASDRSRICGARLLPK